MGLGFDDLLGIPTAGLYNAGKGLAGGYQESGNPIDDNINMGQNRSTITPTRMDSAVFGGSQDAINEQGGMARSSLNTATARSGGWDARAQNPWANAGQAQESQWLSDQEAGARAGDQSGSMQLLRQRAMGLGPSQAAYQLQAGLDKGLAHQSAIAGSARGLGALTQAQGNAGAAGANMQQQAFTEAGRLRAQEMANAQNMYNQASNTQRAQDQARLGQGSQMSQFNAGQRQNYGVQAGQLGLGYHRAGQQDFQNEAGLWNQQANRDQQANTQNFQGMESAKGRALGITQGNIDRRTQRTDRWMDTAMGLGKGTMQMGAGMSGSKPGGK